MLSLPPPPSRGRRRKATGWGAEAPRRGPAHANRAGGGRNPDYEIHAAPPRGGGAAAAGRSGCAKEIARDRSLRAFHATGGARDAQEGQAHPCPSLQSAGEERGEGEGGRRGASFGKESGKTPLPREALPLQLLLPSSLLLGELPRAPTKTSGGVWLHAPAPSDRAAVSLRGEKHVTEPPRSAAWPPPQPPRGSRPGLYIPGGARPAPAPLRPPAVPQRRPRPTSAQRSASAPARPPARAQSFPPGAPPRAPPARRNPRRGRGRGCLGGYPKAGGESGKTAGVGASSERRRSEGGGWRGGGGHCGCRGGVGAPVGGGTELGCILPHSFGVIGQGEEIWSFIRFPEGLLGQPAPWNPRICCREVPRGTELPHPLNHPIEFTLDNKDNQGGKQGRCQLNCTSKSNMWRSWWMK
ncbi:uncharacterized protein RBU33_019779 [Hipposideros larvatus]